MPRGSEDGQRREDSREDASTDSSKPASATPLARGSGAEATTAREGSAETVTDFHIVGIGASAGGLEALETLFEGMPDDTGMAFVVIQHLSPDFKSHLDELLARRTPIPIQAVNDGLRVLPNRIYLIPPRKEMTISGGRLLLTDKDPQQPLALPIDRFLRSLALDCRERSVAIILSGTGSDGSRGVREIHQVGGLVISQSEESAKFDGMPLSAQETGVVDLILPPESMPEALVTHASSLQGTVSRSPVPAPVRSDMDRIFTLLRSEYGIDFTNYKPSTVVRRTERRLSLVDSASLAEYATRLENDPGELNNLYKDLLIGVTEFFRDGEAFARLEDDVIPTLIERLEDGQELRVWVAGCATGEEAYSLAILLREAVERTQRSLNLKLFATDVHPTSLEFASAGVYSEDSLKRVSSERRKKHFRAKPDGYHVEPELRKMIVFAPHNIITDAPFTNLDLITCRNLLIYLQPLAQKKALSLFHFGLKAGGFLFLGSSETPGEISEEFDNVDTHAKIYRKLRDVRLPADLRLPRAGGSRPPRMRAATFEPGQIRRRHSMHDTYERLLARFMPPGFLVDTEFRLLHTFGGAEKFLQIRGGAPPATLVDMLNDDLKTPVAGALHHALRDPQTVRYTGVSFETPEGRSQCRLIVERQASQKTEANYILVLLEELDPPPVRPARSDIEMDADVMSRDHIDSLESELRFTKESLQATIEELETSNEELQATNEELVASNEELQSTNEELHSLNEELYTVNAEHQRKIAELTELTNDLDNLLDNTQIGVIFLDEDLCIRKFTSRIAGIFDLQRSDTGRPIRSFAHTLRDEHIVDDAEAVLQTSEHVEREVFDQRGVCYLLRVLPYRVKGVVQGVVMSLINLDPLKRAEADVARLSALVESSVDAIVGKNLRGEITDWNCGAERLYGYTADEAIGQPMSLIVPESRRDEFEEYMQQVKTGESVAPFQTWRRRKDGTGVEVSLQISPIHGDTGEIVGASAIARDITELQRTRRELQRALRRRDRFLAMLSHELRNPLGAVQNAAQILQRREAGDARHAEARQIVLRQTGQMSRLLDDLLDVSRIAEGKIRIQKQVMDLRETVDDAVHAAENQIRERDQQLHVEVCDEPLYARVDPVRLQQVQINLLNNASKYSPGGESIRLRVARDGEQAVICVRDNGIGISEELQKQIFEPFVQSSDALERADGGMGIGLTLVRALVERHDGTVEVFSEGEGQGSEFLVRLPLLSGIPEHELPDSPQQSAERASRRIVLVEDEEDNRLALKTLLELEGNVVSVAENAERGAELILSEHPDVALVDLGLPDFDGCELARRVRAAEHGRSIRLVALTGYGRAQDIQRTHEAGFDAHIVKPINREKLQQALHSNTREPSQSASEKP